ncbi:Chondroitin sulfate synthase 1 [Branchiostoma belcheri]|nr:Chondroitin sulfate synthase 1 [Branchiostoma belcheri]
MGNLRIGTKFRTTMEVFSGLFVGFWLMLMFNTPPRPTARNCTLPITRTQSFHQGDFAKFQERKRISNPKHHPGHIYIGILTAKKYLKSRGVPAYETWGKQVPGKVEFFSAYDPKPQIPGGVPVVSNIPGIDDTYPPQKKSFLMLKYMHDFYIDDYDWFIRADDDVFIRVDKLQKFLRSVNSSEPFYIGQSGTGKEHEVGKLGLGPGDNYCMGGPGVIMSRETLRRISPHISHCLKNLYSPHEDVEIGRCIKRFANVSCTRSADSERIFYNDYNSYQRGSVGHLRSSLIKQVITLHPNKNSKDQYRLHTYFLALKLEALQKRTLELFRTIGTGNMSSSDLPERQSSDQSTDNRKRPSTPSTGYKPKDIKGVMAWEYFTRRRMHGYLARETSRRFIDLLRSRIKEASMTVSDIVNKASRKERRRVQVYDLQHGYWQVSPLHGLSYVLYSSLLIRESRNRKRKTIANKRQDCFRQSFGPAVLMEDSVAASDVVITLFPREDTPTVHVVVPLVGRMKIFERFMRNYEKVCLQTKENVKLLVVLFKHDDPSKDESLHVQLLIAFYKMKYPKAYLEVLTAEGEFSRGIGLQMGASHFDRNALLFFCDVDLVFPQSFLQRCRSRTVAKKQVYYPVMFSQYDPQFAYGGQSNTRTLSPQTNQKLLTNQSAFNSEKNMDDPYQFSKDSGYWRHYSYGMVCVYKEDFFRSGKFDTAIKGWGLEDLDLCDKLAASGMNVFRATDPGLRSKKDEEMIRFGVNMSTKTRKTVSFILGVVIGFGIMLTIKTQLRGKHVGCPAFSTSEQTPGVPVQGRQAGNRPALHKHKENHIYIGVIAARKYLDSRAVAAYETWGKQVPGKVEFFSAYDPKPQIPGGIPVVSNIPGIDDTYPPQKKSFLMLKYMHDFYIDDYDWFIRADDDVYIRVDKLQKFLRSVNSSEVLYIGQPGFGKDDEFGRLGLRDDENYCMGGPGMIMSREVLRRVVPHISRCLKNLYSSHEDVEIGRCITKFAGVDCTWAYDSRDIFFNDYKHYHMGRIEELRTSVINRAITLHPNKRPEYQYKLHNTFLSMKLVDLRERVLALYRESSSMSSLLRQPPRGLVSTLGKRPSFTRYRPRHVSDVPVWEYFTRTTSYEYAAKNGQPSRGIRKPIKEAIDGAMQKVIENINAGSARSRRTVKYNDLKYGYWQVNPQEGVRYLLHSYLTLREYHRYHARRTLTVRKQVVVQQAFQPVEFVEQNSFNHENVNLKTFADATVHIIVPLTGRTTTFERFMSSYEKVCLQTNENAKLLIVLFKDPNEAEHESEQVQQRISTYQVKYPEAYIKVVTVEREFSRGLALDIGASQFANNSLFFFCDVDIVFKQGVLQRCRSRTIAGEQVYYPVMFSQYDPHIVYGDQSNAITSPIKLHPQLLTHQSAPISKDIRNHFYHFSKDSGYWRHSSYGMVCLSGEDFLRSGKFDLTIRGWGLEDLDLFNGLLVSGMKIFRVTDPGLVHVYHPIHCDSELPERQYQMCLGSKANTYGSTAELVRRWQDIESRGLT